MYKINMIISSKHRMIKLVGKNIAANFVIRRSQPRWPTQPITIIITLWIHVYVLFEKGLLKINTLLKFTRARNIKEQRVLLSKYMNKMKLKLNNLQNFLKV